MQKISKGSPPIAPMIVIDLPLVDYSGILMEVWSFDHV